MSLIQLSLFCDRAIHAFLISAFPMPQAGLDSQIVEPDTFIITSLPAVLLDYWNTVPQHNLVNHVFNTALTL
jgi:hypothetical protein